MDKEKINWSPQQFSGLLLIGLILIFVFVGGAYVISSSANSSKEGTISISFSTIDKGFRSGIKERKVVTIKSEKEWESFWHLHNAPFAPEKQIPLIDLQQEMIVAVFSGEKNTGGYGITITKIEEDQKKGEIIVLLLETQPPPKAMFTQAITQPYHIVKTRRIDLPVKFVPGS